MQLITITSSVPRTANDGWRNNLASRVDGDSATLATQRVEVPRVLWRPQTVSSIWSETWKKLDGERVLVEERPIPV